jgi:hypothetical protein
MLKLGWDDPQSTGWRNMKCEHGKERTRCRDCGGGSFCTHDRMRGSCSICSPESAFKRYQRQAKQRNLSFTLSLEEFEKLVSAACAYCGTQPAFGIDRVDSRIGYVWTAHVRNVWPSCILCNRFKSDLLQHIFLGHAAKITKYQESLKKKAA